MLGLIKKDLLLIKKNLKMLLIIVIAYSFMTLGGDFDISFSTPFLAMLAFISTFSYDDFNNWNAYAITLPSGRLNIVRSKYISSIIIAVISILVGLIISLAPCFINNTTFNLIDNISTLMEVLFAIVILISLMFPFIFKFGSEKGRIWIFGIVICFTTVISIISHFIKFDKIDGIIKLLDNLWFIAIPFIGGIILFISYIVSKHIYTNKEF